MRVIVSWSGGKESCLALYRAMRMGLKPVCLLNMLTWREGRFRVHGIDPRIIADQADAMGIPIVQRRAEWETYEHVFKDAVSKIISEMGAEGIVFGDIFLEEHREWALRVCEELGTRAINPPWGEDEEKLLQELLRSGFQAIIVYIREDKLPREVLGRQLSLSLLNHLKETGIDPCGEYGEYHTLVVDGPIFRKRIEILRGGVKKFSDGGLALNIRGWRIIDKSSQ